MRYAWLVAALAGALWAVPYVLAQDSWWRLLAAVAGALALRQALAGDRERAAILALSGVAVLVKVIAAGAGQNAPLHTLWASSYWALWAMAAFVVVGVSALMVSPLSAALLALVSLSFAGQYLAGPGWLDILSEGFLLGALLAADGGAHGLFAVDRRVARVEHSVRRCDPAFRGGAVAPEALQE